MPAGIKCGFIMNLVTRVAPLNAAVECTRVRSTAWPVHTCQLNMNCDCSLCAALPWLHEAAPTAAVLLLCGAFRAFQASFNSRDWLKQPIFIQSFEQVSLSVAIYNRMDSIIPCVSVQRRGCMVCYVCSCIMSPAAVLSTGLLTVNST